MHACPLLDIPSTCLSHLGPHARMQRRPNMPVHSLSAHRPARHFANPRRAASLVCQVGTLPRAVFRQSTEIGARFPSGLPSPILPVPCRSPPSVSPTSSPITPPTSAPPSRSKVGSALAVTRRPAFPSSPSPMAPASTPCKRSSPTPLRTTSPRCSSSPLAARLRSAALWSRARARGSRLNCRPPRSKCTDSWTIPTPTRSRRSNIRSSTCAMSPTCARAPTPSAPSRACAIASRWQSTASSTSRDSSGCTRRSSPAATVKALAKCSACRRSTR